MERLTPRLVSVRVGAEDLTRFADAAPTAHIKVFLPAPGQDEPTMPIITPEGRVWPEDKPRPVTRTYTPRSYDPATGTLEIQFLLHGEGPASEWARDASVGKKIAIGGPGGRFTPDPSAPRWWIGGDESALPAIGTLLDALPKTAVADVHIEVESVADEIELTSKAQINVAWHHRVADGLWGDALYVAAEAANLDDDVQVWSPARPRRSDASAASC